MSRHRRSSSLPDLARAALPDWLRGAAALPEPDLSRDPDGGVGPLAGCRRPDERARHPARAAEAAFSPAPAAVGSPSAALVAHSLDELRGLQRAIRARQQADAAAAVRAAEAAAAERRVREVFARAVGPITPMPDAGRHLHAPPRPAPVARQRDLDEAAVLRQSLSDDFDPHTLMETDDQLSYSRRGVGPDVLKQLRGGRWSVQGQIDLHGHTRDEAREALGGFLQTAGKRGWRCVRVVHGKGLGSPGRQPVLKGKVRSWLVQRIEVLAFAQATGPDGGAGALIVLLDSA